MEEGDQSQGLIPTKFEKRKSIEGATIAQVIVVIKAVAERNVKENWKNDRKEKTIEIP